MGTLRGTPGEDAPPAPDDFVGRTVGNWQLLRRLGEGSFGSVYEAQNVGISGRKAAVKVLHPHMSSSRELKQRFLNEASAASRADHPNIVQIFDGGITHDGICYSVMELLRGTTLTDVITHEGRLHVSRTLDIGAEVAGALEAAHEMAIVHRDLKPDNIFIATRPGQPEIVKVLDFGVAKLIDADQSVPRTQVGMLVGTPAYMSPEQWMTLRDIDGRSDVYSLGVILHECLSGDLPFMAETPYSWQQAHLNMPPPDLREMAGVPDAVAALVERLLAKSRDERLQSMGEVREAIDELRAALQKGGDVAALPRPMLLKRPWGGPGASPRPSGRTLVSPPPAWDESQAAGGLSAPTAELIVPRLEKVEGQTDQMPILLDHPLLRDDPEPPDSPDLTPTMPAIEAVQARRSLAQARARRRWVLGGVAVGALASVAAIVSKELARPRDITATPSTVLAPAPRPQPPPPPPAPKLPSEFAVFGPGDFLLGWDNRTDGPPHRVPVGHFALAKYEVTMGEYQKFATATHLGGELPWDGVDDFASIRDLPVNSVAQPDAARYCAWRYPGAATYLGKGRLPTEAEWEFAARDGRADRRYPWEGDKFDAGRVNAAPRGQHANLVPVDAMPAGATSRGLAHMIGNVAEWTSTPGTPYPGSKAPAPARGTVVVRGGGADTLDVEDLTATARKFVAPETKNPFIGFRCAVDVK